MDHDAVTAPEGVQHVWQIKTNVLHFARHGGLRVLKTMAVAGAQRVAAQ